MIYISFNNLKDEIVEYVGRNPADHDIGNGSRSARRPKFVSFFVNNKSSYFEQLTNTMEMKQVDMDDTETNNIVSIMFN